MALSTEQKIKDLGTFISNFVSLGILFSREICPTFQTDLWKFIEFPATTDDEGENENRFKSFLVRENLL